MIVIVFETVVYPSSFKLRTYIGNPQCTWETGVPEDRQPESAIEPPFWLPRLATPPALIVTRIMISIVQWATKVMKSASMYFLWKQGKQDFCNTLSLVAKFCKIFVFSRFYFFFLIFLLFRFVPFFSPIVYPPLFLVILMLSPHSFARFIFFLGGGGWIHLLPCENGL